MDLRILHVADEVWGDDARGVLDRDARGTPVRTDVVRAPNLRDACMQLRAVPFDVVLLDLSARQRGPGALHRLREADAEVPVVVWACELTPSHRAAWVRAGATELMEDGFDEAGRLLGALLRAARRAWTRGGDVAPKARHERHS